MGKTFTRLKDRLSERRSQRRANAGERALQRRAAKAKRLEHVRNDNRYLPPGGP